MAKRRRFLIICSQWNSIKTLNFRRKMSGSLSKVFWEPLGNNFTSLVFADTVWVWSAHFVGSEFYSEPGAPGVERVKLSCIVKLCTEETDASVLEALPDLRKLLILLMCIKDWFLSWYFVAINLNNFSRLLRFHCKCFNETGTLSHPLVCSRNLQIYFFEAKHGLITAI